MSFLRSLAEDLRERQVLPAVLLLALLAIAIPVYATIALANSPAPVPINPAPVDAAPPHGAPPPGQELSAVETAQSQRYTVYKGQEPNPFGTAASGSASPSASTSTPVAKPSKTLTPTTTKPIVAPSSTAPKSESAPKTLSGHEAYTIDAVTTYGSEKDTLDNIERLAPIPANLPAMVYLGVLKGGKYAAFALGGDTVVGTGNDGWTCLPSGADCQVLEIAPGHKLTLHLKGDSVSTFTFKLSSIGAQKFASKSAATAARKASSAAGEAILAKSTTVNITGFVYKVHSGVLVYTPQTGTTGVSGTTGTSGSTGMSGATGASG